MATDDLFDLDYLEPKGEATFTLPGVHVPPWNPKPVTLRGVHVGPSNEGWVNAVMLDADARDGGAATKADRDRSDIATAKRLARFGLTGWEDVCDKAMAPVAFTKEKAEKLLLTLLAKNRRDLVVAPVTSALAHFADVERFQSPRPTAEALGNG